MSFRYQTSPPSPSNQNSGTHRFLFHTLCRRMCTNVCAMAWLYTHFFLCRVHRFRPEKPIRKCNFTHFAACACECVCVCRRHDGMRAISTTLCATDLRPNSTDKTHSKRQPVYLSPMGSAKCARAHSKRFAKTHTSTQKGMF